MTRRSAILMATSAAVAKAEKIPTEPHEINPFTIQMNLYIELRQRGEISVKQWRNVVRAWRRMTDV